MRLKYLWLLALVALLVVACGPEMVTPTPPESADTAGEAATATSVEETAPVAVEVETPAAGEPITETEPISPPGGVEVALEAIDPVEGVLATVNGQEISWDDYEPELRQALYGVTQQYGVDWNQAENIALLGTLQDQVLQTVVSRALIRQLAAEEGIEIAAPDLQARIDEEKASILESGQFSSWEDFTEQTGIGDEFFARLVEDVEIIDLLSEAHGPDREVEQVHARHILVEDEATGQEVLDRLEAGDDWAELAAEYSQDTGNKDNAGDLDWFPRGMMVGPFEEVAFSLEPGETSDLVETDFGYHIIQVLETGARELDEQMYASMVQQAFQEWLDEQRTAAETEILVQFASGE
jgi:parvulin-like peptidyl-prolyl isomerase